MNDCSHLVTEELVDGAFYKALSVNYEPYEPDLYVLREDIRAALLYAAPLIADKKKAVLESFRETWDGSRFEGDPSRVDTDLIRQGWSSPTLYKEHEVIHILAGVIDYLRNELEKKEQR